MIEDEKIRLPLSLLPTEVEQVRTRREDVPSVCR